MAFKLTQSQKQMIQLARVHVPSHHIDVVKIEAPRSGLSHVIKQAQKESKLDRTAPLSIGLCATSNWDVIVSLNEVAGGGCMGYGWLNAYMRGFKKIADENQRDELCVWLEHAGNLSIAEQEIIAQRATWAADRANVRLHLIYLVQKIDGYDQETYKMKRIRNVSSHLLIGSADWVFTDEGLDVLETTEQPRASRIA